MDDIKTNAPVNEAVEQPQAPNVYPQDDGTVLVVLNDALKRKDGSEFREVTIIRGLTAAEEDKSGGSTAFGMGLNHAFSKVIGNITEPQITGNRFMNMESNDRTLLKQGITYFFG